MSRRPRPAPRAFTLLEVMVALGILAGALLVLSDVVSGALRNHVRSQHLEVATLLARAKMAELEDHYEAKGFAAAGESDDGTFEDEDHPEIRWRVEVAVPPGDLGPDTVLRVLMQSDEGLKDLLPPPDQAPQLGSYQAQLTAALQTVLARLAEQMKQGVRQVQLTVTWPEGGRDESFTVTTDMVVLQPGGQK